MTTIAWDGKTLAGDRQSTFDGTPARTRKVFRFSRPDRGDVVLCGCAGDTGDCQVYIRWAKDKDAIKKGPPAFKSLVVLSIDSKRRIWCATENMHWYRIGAKFWAIGSGAEYALGAMAAGKSARDAVRIASKLDTSTGFGVDVVSFR